MRPTPNYDAAFAAFLLSVCLVVVAGTRESYGWGATGLFLCLASLWCSMNAEVRD